MWWIFTVEEWSTIIVFINSFTHFFNSHPGQQRVYPLGYMNTKPHVTTMIATLAMLFTTWNLGAKESVVTGAMVGHWEGEARIIVTWCHQKNLSVKVDLHEDGTVTGTVGDATLTLGRFQQNRGWLGRKLNMATDYIIKGGLNGAIVKAEGITRSEVMIPLNFSGGTFTGGINTSGTMLSSKDKRKERMPLSTASLTLTHSQIVFATDEARKACDIYRIEMVVAPSQSRCDGNMVLRYENQTSNSLAVLRLHLDPNMSANQSLEIISVEDDTGMSLAWNYQPLKFGNLHSDKGAADVRLPKALAPFGQTTVSMKFRSSGNNIVSDMVALQDGPYQSLDGWYPKAMTACGGGWSLDDDRPADYDVTVQLPSEFGVASTGRVLNETSREKERVLHLKAERVRGFTVYAFPHWQRRERRVGQVELGICLPRRQRRGPTVCSIRLPTPSPSMTRNTLRSHPGTWTSAAPAVWTTGHKPEVQRLAT